MARNFASLPAFRRRLSRPLPLLSSRRSARRLPSLRSRAMTACVEAAAAAPHRAAAAQRTRKRMRVDVGSTDDYDYEETCRLGEGAFGVVVKGRHRATGQAVAMKYLGGHAGGHAAAAALLREATFLAACAANRFVVGSRGLARDPATAELCLVMDCCGASLRDVLPLGDTDGSAPTPTPPLPEATVRAAIRQLLKGAKRMHRAHVVHRDIKPENILVGDDGAVRFCDLGLAVHMAEPPPYEPAGTLWYMAPEVLLGRRDHDALVDTWSLGCVMAELVDGRVLFQEHDAEDQLCAIFGLLGMPTDASWPWFSSTAFGAQIPEPERQLRKCNLLGCRFPESKLSKEGFGVLSGLLTCNPDKRLTAAAALKRPWFRRDRRAAAAGKER